MLHPHVFSNFCIGMQISVTRTAIIFLNFIAGYKIFVIIFNFDVTIIKNDS